VPIRGRPGPPQVWDLDRHDLVVEPSRFLRRDRTLKNPVSSHSLATCGGQCRSTNARAVWASAACSSESPKST